MRKEEYNTDIHKNNSTYYNVAIYIDYENVTRILLKQYRNVIRDGFFEKIRAWCNSQNRRVVKIAVYCNYDVKDLYESHHQSLLQSYGVETIHTSNQGKNFADLKISIDVLNEMYVNDNVDEFIIMSNDKDMTPLLNTVRANKRKVSVITIGENYNKALVEFADEHIDYDTIINNTNAGKLYIDELADKIFNGIQKITSKNLEEFQCKKANNQKSTFSKHYCIDYFIESQSTYYQIMSYEFLNIIKNYWKENKIIIYTAKYGKNKTDSLCLLPSSLEDIFIENDIIDKSNIITTYNFDLLISKKYENYLNNY